MPSAEHGFNGSMFVVILYPVRLLTERIYLGVV